MFLKVFETHKMLWFKNISFNKTLTLLPLGENIKYGRKLYKISQEDLAKQLNVSPNSVSNWERDHTEPNLEALVRMSRLFMISVDDLLKKDLEKEGFSTEMVSDSRVITLNYHNILVEKEHFERYCDFTNADDLKRVIIPGIQGKGRTFEVTNDAMAPLLMFGDYVGCVPVAKINDVAAGRIFVLVTKKSEILIQYCQSYKEGLRVFPHNMAAGVNWQLIPYSQIFEVWEVSIRLTRHFLIPYVISEVGPQVLNEPKSLGKK